MQAEVDAEQDGDGSEDLIVLAAELLLALARRGRRTIYGSMLERECASGQAHASAVRSTCYG